MERPIQFSSGKETITGILNVPDVLDGRRPDVGVVFVHAGSRGRLGNTFQYPFYARQFSAAGYASLRWDPPGIGDSTGIIEHINNDDFYGQIQVGRFVPDTIAAVDEFFHLIHPKKLVLFGLCGGAITALLAAPRLTQRVDGLILLSIPVLLDSSQACQMARLPRSLARQYLLTNYARKILSPQAWMRMLRGKSELSTIFTMMKASFKGAGNKPLAQTSDEDPNGTCAARFNDLFLESLDVMMERGTRIQFIFGDDDAFRWEFEREFYKVHWENNPQYAQYCEVHYIPGCNHMFTLAEWQRQAMEISLPMLKKYKRITLMGRE